MGKVGNAGLSLASGGLLGNNPVSRALGLSGEQGEYFTPEQMQQRKLNEFVNADHSSKIDGIKGMQTASDTFQNNSMQKGLFGEGGLQSRLGEEEQRLASQGFQLTPEDMTAYGQTSGDISRLFGQQENDVSKSLARRGLGAGSSGAASAAFSGVAGNKNEMLAKAQTDIAQRRYQDTMSRINSTRSQMQSLGAQANAGVNQQFDNQIKGYNTQLSGLQSAVQGENALNNQMKASQESKTANKGQTLFDAVGQGLFSGVKTATSKGVSQAASGGMGA